MAAELKFYGGPSLDQELAGSGLGFYGAGGFGASIPVGSYQGRTFITTGDGTAQGAECPNVKFLDSASGILGQAGTGIALTAIPNPQASLRVRFTNDSAVKAENVKAYVYDRYSTSNPASGVTTKMAELIHPTVTQANDGSGDTSWYTPSGTGTVVPMANSPGPSGLYAGNGSNSLYSNTVHDWYLAISASPDSIGSKSLFGFLVSCEYL